MVHSWDFLKKLAALAAIVLMVPLLVQAQPPPGVIYVKEGYRNGNGQSWSTAFGDLQEALGKASIGQQIWIAAGTYYPTSGQDRSASFVLKEGVEIYGGFSGSETSREARDWKAYPSILSGDIGQKNTKTDNSKHVVTGANNAVLDGFTITGGYSAVDSSSRPSRSVPPLGPPSGPPSGPGSGQQTHTSPQNILQSKGEGFGAGILNFNAAPLIRNCTITGNEAMKGGGVYNVTPGKGVPRFWNVMISNNFAVGRGGGMSNDLFTNPILVNVSFINNSTNAKGGGLYNDFNCSPLLINALFIGNRAAQAAAMGNDGSSSPVIFHATIVGNTATDSGGALYQGTYNADMGKSNRPVVINSILWGNRSLTGGAAEVCNWAESEAIIQHSIVEGSYPGVGNTADDPGFVNVSAGDFRLAKTGKGASLRGTTVYGIPATDLAGAKRELVALPGALGIESAESSASSSSEKSADALVAALLKAFPPATSPGGMRNEQPVGGQPASVGPQAGSDEVRAVPSSVVFRVNPSSRSGMPDGKSWNSAFLNVQDALDAAAAAGGGEVWLAAGVYKPTQGSGRSASFVLKEMVGLYGGFAGTETSRDQRDPVKNKVVLSGDLEQPGVASDNAYHVVIGADDAVLDGLSVVRGQADGTLKDSKGGAVLCYHGASVILENVTLAENYASEGGALYAYDDCLLLIRNSRLESNHAETGGAAIFRDGSNAKISGTVFISNSASFRGGAVLVDYGASPTFTNCSFISNSTKGNGGAVQVDDRASQIGGTTPVFESCTFEGNTAAFRGGAIQNFNLAKTVVRSCVFDGNKAGTGGGALANDDSPNVQLNENTMKNNSGGSGKNDVDASGSSAGRSPQSSSIIVPFNVYSGERSAASFSVVTVGTGTPQYDSTRSGPSALIQYGDKNYLVDMGNGTQVKLQDLGLNVRQLSGVLLTHHHIDHDEEFIPIYVGVCLAGGKAEVIGPPGTKMFSDFILKFYAEDIAYRLTRRGEDVAKLNTPLVSEINGSETFTLDQIKVTTAKVNHSIHTVAYRFDVDGKSIVISGDTAYSESLIELARGADVLVMDSGGAIVKKAGAGMRQADYQGNRSGDAQDRSGSHAAHPTMREVGEMAKKGGVKKLVLTHIVPGEVDKVATLAALSKYYSGEVIIAHDGLKVTIPSIIPGNMH